MCLYLVLRLWATFLAARIDFVQTSDLVSLPRKVFEIRKMLLIVLQNTTQREKMTIFAKIPFVSLSKYLATTEGPI